MISSRHCGPWWVTSRVSLSTSRSAPSRECAGGSARVTAPVASSSVRSTRSPRESRSSSGPIADCDPTGSSINSSVPPQGRPKRCAASAPTP